MSSRSLRAIPIVEEKWGFLAKTDNVKSYLPLLTTEKLATGAGQGAGSSRHVWGRGCWRPWVVVIGCGAAADEPNGHKKTVSESETVAGQHSEKITEIPEAKSGEPMVAKTFRSTRVSQLSRVPRFINKFFG